MVFEGGGECLWERVSAPPVRLVLSYIYVRFNRIGEYVILDREPFEMVRETIDRLANETCTPVAF